LATGGLAQADITIHSDPAVLESGQECLLTAHDPSHQDACYSWELLLPGSGTLLNPIGPDRIRYRAPRLPHPQNVIIRANITNGPVPKWVDKSFHIGLPKVLILPSPRDPKGWAALDASPQAAWAAAARPVVVSLRSCELTAVHEDWEQRSFKWSADAPQGGQFTLSAQGRGVVYHAPLVLKRQTFRITATDPGGAKGSCLVDVLPPPMPKRLKDVLQPGNQVYRTRLARSMGEDWLLPHMTSFAELPAPLEAGAGSVHCIQYVDDAEAGFPDRSWLVGRRDGIWKASRPDEVARVALKGQISMFSVRADGPEPFPKTACTAMAVRIPGSQAPAGRALVIGLEKRERDRQSYICALGPDGTVKPIVGSGDSKSASQFDYGSAKEVACPSVAGLALDRLGNIIWLDRQGNLRTISLDGKVAPFAAASRCRYEDRDKAERWRLLPRIDAHSAETYCGLALDPDSGELFVASSRRVYRIKPGGAATLVLGEGLAGAGGVAPHPPVQDPYQAYPCRLQSLRDLKLHHGCLYY
jgi:hypothetical protein